MELKEIRRIKAEFEAELSKLIAEFEDITGAAIGFDYTATFLEIRMSGSLTMEKEVNRT